MAETMQTQLLGPRLSELASATGTLSPRQIRLVGGMLAEIGRLDRRKTALLAARDALDPASELGNWQVALRLELAIKRLKGQPIKRILAGYRQPTEIEKLLIALLACGGPTCQERLNKELRELTDLGQ